MYKGGKLDYPIAMREKESRRIVPVSYAAIAVLALVFAFEAAVMGGLLEIRSSTVARIAPWAYGPFLKLVGEHPDVQTWRTAPAPPAPGAEASGAAVVAGIDPSLLSVEIDPAAPATNILLETIVPVQAAPERSESAAGEQSPDEDAVPVG